MYYTLTKNEYKKYEKDFKKTFIGKQLFIDRILFAILFPLIVLDMGFVGIDFFESSTSSEYFYFPIICVLSIIAGIGTFLSRIEYGRELKNYIISKK